MTNKNRAPVSELRAQRGGVCVRAGGEGGTRWRPSRGLSRACNNRRARPLGRPRVGRAAAALSGALRKTAPHKSVQKTAQAEMPFVGAFSTLGDMADVYAESHDIRLSRSGNVSGEGRQKKFQGRLRRTPRVSIMDAAIADTRGSWQKHSAGKRLRLMRTGERRTRACECSTQLDHR